MSETKKSRFKHLAQLPTRFPSGCSKKQNPCPNLGSSTACPYYLLFYKRVNISECPWQVASHHEASLGHSGLATCPEASPRGSKIFTYRKRHLLRTRAPRSQTFARRGDFQPLKSLLNLAERKDNHPGTPCANLTPAEQPPSSPWESCRQPPGAQGWPPSRCCYPAAPRGSP